MIITPAHIRMRRALSASIPDINVVSFIEEAENLYVRNTLTPALYKAIEDSVIRDDFNRPYTDEDEVVTTEDGQYDLLLAGGYYDEGTKHFSGLIAAVAYLAYSRLVMQHGVNATSFGMTQNTSEYSQSVDFRTRKDVSNKAEKTGLLYLSQCVEYLKFIELLPCDSASRKRGRIRVIGS